MYDGEYKMYKSIGRHLCTCEYPSGGNACFFANHRYSTMYNMALRYDSALSRQMHMKSEHLFVLLVMNGAS